MLRRDDWYVADSNAFVTIFEKTLKDHGLLFKKDIKSSISEAEAVLNSFMESASSRWLVCRGYKTFYTFLKNILWSGRIIYQVISREFNETRSRNACLTPFRNQTSMRFTNALLWLYALLNYYKKDEDQRRRLSSIPLWNLLRRDGWTVADLNLYYNHTKESTSEVSLVSIPQDQW